VTRVFTEPHLAEANGGAAHLRVSQLVKLFIIAPAPGAALIVGETMRNYRGEYAIDVAWRLLLIAFVVSVVLEVLLVAPIMLLWPRARMPSLALAAVWGCLVGLCGALLLESPDLLGSTRGLRGDAQMLSRWFSAAWPFGALGALCGAFYAWLASRAARVIPRR
jgi:hypothetical protein